MSTIIKENFNIKNITSLDFVVNEINYENDDCLFNIFATMSPQDIFSCASVNKRWNITASKDHLWTIFISKMFKKTSIDFFDGAQISQKELFRHIHNFDNGLFIKEKFPEGGSFHLLKQQEKTTFISDQGNIYSWNAKTQKFDFNNKLWDLSPKENNYPYDCYKLELCIQRVLPVSKDIFSVLCKKSGWEIKEEWKDRGFKKEAIKVKGTVLKNFNKNNIESSEISLDCDIKDIRVMENGQFIALSEDSEALINIETKSITKTIFRSGFGYYKRAILDLRHDKCLVAAIGAENYEDKYSVSLFNISNGTTLLSEIDSYSTPLLPLHPEFSDNHLILVPEDGKCKIFDLDCKCNTPLIEIPFGEDFIHLASFTPQGKLLLSDLKSKIILLDPKNHWNQIRSINIDFSARLEIRRSFDGFQTQSIGTKAKVIFQFIDSEKVYFSSSKSDQCIVFDLINGEHIVSSKENSKFEREIVHGLIVKGDQLINYNPSLKNCPQLQLIRRPPSIEASIEFNAGYGNSLVLCGNGGGLSWDPSQGKPLKCHGNNKWTISIPSDAKEFKLVLKAKDGTFQWEKLDGNHDFSSVQFPLKPTF